MSGFRELETAHRIEARRIYGSTFVDEHGPEVWQIKILGFFPSETWSGKPTSYRVVVDRLPDPKECAWPYSYKLPMRIEHEDENLKSLVAARKRAKLLAEVFACGKAAECIGIFRCGNGEPCPLGLKG